MSFPAGGPRSWHVSFSGRTLGPVPEERLVRLIQEGVVPRDARVSPDGVTFHPLATALEDAGRSAIEPAPGGDRKAPLRQPAAPAPTPDRKIAWIAGGVAAALLLLVLFLLLTRRTPRTGSGPGTPVVATQKPAATPVPRETTAPAPPEKKSPDSPKVEPDEREGESDPPGPPPSPPSTGTGSDAPASKPEEPPPSPPRNSSPEDRPRTGEPVEGDGLPALFQDPRPAQKARREGKRTHVEAWEEAARRARGRALDPSHARVPAYGAPGTSVSERDGKFTVSGYLEGKTPAGGRKTVRFTCVLLQVADTFDEQSFAFAGE